MIEVSDTFEDWGAFVEAAARTVRSPEWDKIGAGNPRTLLKPEWHGTASWADCLERARFGSPEDAARVVRAYEAVRQHVAPIRARAERFDVAGHRPHVARAVSGDPCSMVRRSSQQNSRARVVRLLVDVCANWKVKAEAISNRAAAILAYADALENAGQRLEIEIGFVTVGTRKIDGTRRIVARKTTRAIIKRADQPMSIEALAFALVNPSTLRRLEVAFSDCRAELAPGFGKKFGFPYPIQAAPDQVLLPMLEETDEWALFPQLAAERVSQIFETSAQSRAA